MSRRRYKVEDDLGTYHHPENFARTELADITKECARLRISHAWTVDDSGKVWRIQCPSELEDQLLKALKAAGS